MEYGFTLFSQHQGSGYIYPDPDSIKENTEFVPFIILDKTIHPGDKTDLCGFLSIPIEYVGMKAHKEAVFLIGSDTKDMFSKELFYYQSIHIITPERIYETYGMGSGRDFIYKDGMWK